MKRPYRGSAVESKRNSDRAYIPTSISSHKQQLRRVELPSINKILPQQKMPTEEDDHYNQQNYVDEALGNLFHEYFIKNGYMKTLDCFQRQQGRASGRKEPQEFKRLLLESFDSGNKGQFFRVFNKYTPLHIRMKDERTTKLEFYLNIYFLIFNVLPANNANPLKKKPLISNETRQSFQKYLKSKGQALASTSEFLPYYALAYIEPFENPEFKQLFTPQWVEQLRKKVISFVDCLYPAEKAVICQIYQDYVGKSLKESDRQTSTFNNNGEVIAKKNEKIEELEQRNYDMQNYLQSLTDKYWQFQNNFKKFGQSTKNTLIQSQKKWFQMTQEIFLMAATALEIAQSRKSDESPQAQAEIKRIKQRMLKYQGFINTNIDDLISQDVDFSMFEKPSVSAQNEVEREVTEPITFVSLDVKKIKDTLMGQNIDQIVAILKALKYRIKVAQGVYQKRQVVVELVIYDVLGAKQEGQALLNRLLFGDRRVCEEVVKLVSFLADDYYGRTYLFTIVQPLMNLMMGEKGDTTVRRNLIVTFQFMSVRRRGNPLMLNNNIIQWIVNILKTQKQTVDEESLSYLVVLLMNLSFTKEGLDKCQEIRDDLMSNLIELLQHKNKDIQSYINGALYRVLSRKSFRDKAHEHGLADIIDYQIKSGASVDCTQLNHVKGMLEKEESEHQHPEQTDVEDLDDGGDVDDIDDQPLIHLINDQEETDEVNGERLLIESYTLAGPQMIDHMKAISRQVDESLKRRQTSFIRNEMNSQDRPRSMMRPLLRNRSNMSGSRVGSASTRMLPSELRQRVRPHVEGDQQLAPVSPMSRERDSSLGNSQVPRPIRDYQNHPQYRQVFQPRNQIVRTPPHSNM